ncbi:FAD-dependent monooxygenase [Legionella quateirensis]|uniref:FAD monooxygenase, PheA/TfdB family n=1 Tax=Legionella quateirensis TaxID=45072 RepID=A0A378KRZ1_9GAMM|nr:FAD-dependent monooxygenase [Legionella quateirensis]KTD43669.1 FAD monooxygenase, PheA/TfdB family [Legionella quateirensis]STY17343.1 FAD monooxygenase, PheA/TfdB family [Legionella quateirensis]
MINSNYEVIIVGGGPVGIALAIELGLNQVKTLVLEKYAKPLKMPRAQSLSARTMEFFIRWGADMALEESLLLPKDLPQTGIWCSTLCGETYFETAWGDNQLKENASPKAGVRSPIWITEEVLRTRLQAFPSVDFLKEHEVQDIQIDNKIVSITSFDKNSQQKKVHQANYLACCDGSTGPTKQLFNNCYNTMSDATKMLGTMFISKELMQLKTVPDGIMYFVLAEGAMAFVGPIDLQEGLWLAQIVWNKPEDPDELSISSIIDAIVGIPIEKEIVDFNIWDMQVKIADFFNFNNQVFWLGDSAHAFAPTGGLGLNTGFGDAHNLGWKLAAVIQNKASAKLLETYAKERHPIWLSNLNFAGNNALEFLELKKKYPPEVDYKAYTMAYADLGNRYLRSSGLTLGYAYFDSPLTQLMPQQVQENNPFEYTPKTEPGYFLPHAIHQNDTIYATLSPTLWNLIVCDSDPVQESEKKKIADVFSLDDIHIVKVAANTYPYSYLLLRPDWHIARLGNSLDSIAGSIQEKLQCA